LSCRCLFWSLRDGYSVILCDSNEDPVQEQELLNVLIRRRVDGILLASTQASLAESRLGMRRPPSFALTVPPTGPAVVVDNVLASYEVTRHLIELGQQRAGIGKLAPHDLRSYAVRKTLPSCLPSSLWIAESVFYDSA
jgi:LacI family transcriptional regulator